MPDTDVVLRVILGALTFVAFIAVAELVEGLIHNTSEFLVEKLGALTLRFLTRGRYPTRSRSTAERVFVTAFGLVILITVILFLIVTLPRLT